MKKVWVVLSLVLALLLCGCRSEDPLRGFGEEQPSVAASKSRASWDSNLRPTRVASKKSRSKPRVAKESQEEPLLMPRDEQVASTPIESAPQPTPTRSRTTTKPMPAQPELVTASVEDLQPVGSTSAVAAYDKSVRTQTGLVAMEEAGGNTLSITYPRPDYGIIQVDKAMPQEVRLNTPFTYVIRVSNLTEMMLTEITITETLSKDFEFKASEPLAKTEEDRLIWEIDSLGPRASKSIKISGVATSSRPLEHCTAVTHTARNCAVVKIVEPALELVRNAPSEALLCEPIPVEFVVTNTGTGVAQNVQIVDTLPAGLQTTDGKSKVVLEAGTLAAGEVRRFNIKLRATKTGAYVNKAVATSAAGLSTESEPSMINVRQPVLVLAKSGPKRQYLGRSVTYELTISNKGDGPAQNTVIEDIVPPGVTNVEATAGAQFAGNKLVWELGTIEPNASKNVRVSYTPTREGELMATATATAYCAEPVSDSIRTGITGIAAVRLEVVDVEDPVEVGGNATYLITATNEGTAADSNIRVSAILDDKVQYVSSAGATAGSVLGKTISFAPLRTLEPKGKATWRIVVKGAVAGDVRIKVTMHTDQLALPVEETEATRIYQQFNEN
ncbi:MAG: hypothetical protein ACM3VT_00245 [Solirubrobacterales bacterium]